MSSLATVAIHASQFPEIVRRDLLESLRAREVNHKFHYDSIKQTRKWLALHSAYSPSRNDADCIATYERGFEGATARIETDRVHLLGLGCGGGQKDSRLLQLLRESRKEAFYTPCDVSVSMVLVARQAALTVIPAERCSPLVCDLARTEDLPAILDEGSVGRAVRLISFFGMIPNFEPQIILPRLAALVRGGDVLLLSVNLAPGPDYEAGIQKILPLYDNEQTRDWLMTFLLDLGLESNDGDLQFRVEEWPARSGLKRVAAYFQFLRPREFELDEQRFGFRPGDSLRLFYSYRYTPIMLCSLLPSHGLKVLAQWVAKSQEEAVFLCCRT